MKKLGCFFAFSFVAGSLFAAASTCETRVDKHPNATTSERVEYCLTEESPAEEQDTTEVVLSDVYSVQYPKPKTKQRAPVQQVTKVFTTAPVSMEYLDRDDYPAFRNDIMPSLSPEDAHTAALEALGSPVSAKENTGKKSLKKPGREMKVPPQAEVPAVTDTASYGQTYPAYQATPAYQAPVVYGNGQTVPAYQQQPGAEQTSPTQIQQAQAIPNDPQNPVNNTGVPAGFEGNALDQNNFGYNTTDPALQP